MCVYVHFEDGVILPILFLSWNFLYFASFQFYETLYSANITRMLNNNDHQLLVRLDHFYSHKKS